MIARLRYGYGVYRCIAQIGVKPGRVPSSFKRSIRDLGFMFKNTPQECATAMLYNLPTCRRPDNYDVVLSDWIDRGLVRRDVLESIVRRV